MIRNSVAHFRIKYLRDARDITYCRLHYSFLQKPRRNLFTLSKLATFHAAHAAREKVRRLARNASSAISRRVHGPRQYTAYTEWHGIKARGMAYRPFASTHYVSIPFRITSHSAYIIASMLGLLDICT